MAAGGQVAFGDALSRYSNNGHVDPSRKHWFGWLEDSDAMFMDPGGASESAACPQCVSAWSGKLNASDRPDVIPGQTAASSESGSTAFAIRVAYTPTSLLYNDESTSTTARRTRLGVSVQHCRRPYSPGLNVGASSACYTHDAAGDRGCRSPAARP